MSTHHVALLVVALSLAACDSIGLQASSPQPTPGSVPSASEPWAEMLSAVNAVRADGATCGGAAYPSVAPLVWDSLLAEAALVHSLDMAANDHFLHVGTDGSKVGDRADEVGYAWQAIGENIAYLQPTVENVVQDWLASPIHCRQIMDPAFAEMGAAEEDLYWTLVFGAPL